MSKDEEKVNSSFLNEEEREETTELQEEQPTTSEETTSTDNLANDNDSLQKKYDELNDSHLRLMAEFDNYRKRTLREKADLIKMGGETILTNILPIIDDFERAIQTIQNTEDIAAVVEGVKLIYTKFNSFLNQQGVKTIDPIGNPLDTETSEAVAIIPAPEEELKGKVLECVQTGYTLNDKVIRHAKVVVGE